MLETIQADISQLELDVILMLPIQACCKITPGFELSAP